MKRLFVAIPVPVHTLHDVVDAAQRRDDHRWRWVQPDTSHITLAFLGSIDDARVALISKALTNLRSAEFAVELGSIKSFPSREYPRVLALIPRNSEQLRRLFDAVRSSLEPLFPRLGHTFRPHVTLARTRMRGRQVADTGAIEKVVAPLLPVSFMVSNVNLYDSTTAPDRAYYTVLKSISLVT